MVVDLASVVRPDLTVLDARLCFVNGGPWSGQVREACLILASGDRVAIDVEGIKVIQGFRGASLLRDPWSYAQIRRTVELGLGSTSPLDYMVVGDV
jgi:uncharacterized protein (DUF362 family)